MRDSNVPKFLRDDLPLFHAIVGDLFPGVVVPKQETGDLERYAALSCAEGHCNWFVVMDSCRERCLWYPLVTRSAIRDELAKQGLQAVALHIDKILQLYDTFNVRFGVVITGPTTAGKTTAYRLVVTVTGSAPTSVPNRLSAVDFTLLLSTLLYYQSACQRHVRSANRRSRKRHVPAR